MENYCIIMVGKSETLERLLTTLCIANLHPTC